jgi:hypothetical protein
MEVTEAGRVSMQGMEVMNALGQGCQYRGEKFGVSRGFGIILHLDKAYNHVWNNK